MLKEKLETRPLVVMTSEIYTNEDPTQHSTQKLDEFEQMSFCYKNKPCHFEPLICQEKRLVFLVILL